MSLYERLKPEFIEKMKVEGEKYPSVIAGMKKTLCENTGVEELEYRFISLLVCFNICDNISILDFQYLFD